MTKNRNINRNKNFKFYNFYTFIKDKIHSPFINRKFYYNIFKLKIHFILNIIKNIFIYSLNFKLYILQLIFIFLINYIFIFIINLIFNIYIDYIEIYSSLSDQIYIFYIKIYNNPSLYLKGNEWEPFFLEENYNIFNIFPEGIYHPRWSGGNILLSMINIFPSIEDGNIIFWMKDILYKYMLEIREICLYLKDVWNMIIEKKIIYNCDEIHENINNFNYENYNNQNSDEIRWDNLSYIERFIMSGYIGITYGLEELCEVYIRIYHYLMWEDVFKTIGYYDFYTNIVNYYYDYDTSYNNNFKEYFNKFNDINNNFNTSFYSKMNEWESLEKKGCNNIKFNSYNFTKLGINNLSLNNNNKFYINKPLDILINLKYWK